jgi:hypothetical protein
MVKIAIFSSGWDIRKDRGYENSSHNLFLNLQQEPDLEAHFFQGQGKNEKNIKTVPSFAHNRLVWWLGNKIFNDTYVFEYIIFALSFIIYNWFNHQKFDAYYTQEPRVAKTFYQLKKFLIGKPKIVFGMGVKMTPEHYVNICDRAQIVNIEHFNRAIKEYPESNKFRLIPNPPAESKIYNKEKTISELRNIYEIKTEKVIVAVGAINKGIKRMDYVVNEIGKLDDSWTLILLGKLQETSILNQGIKLMGSRIKHFFLPPEKVSEIIYMSDMTVLASVVEGFPNVLLEAIQNSRVPILHNRPLNIWGLGGDTFSIVDMLEDGALTKYLKSIDLEDFRKKGNEYFDFYKNTYTWNKMRAAYRELLYCNG